MSIVGLLLFIFLTSQFGQSWPQILIRFQKRGRCEEKRRRRGEGGVRGRRGEVRERRCSQIHEPRPLRTWTGMSKWFRSSETGPDVVRRATVTHALTQHKFLLQIIATTSSWLESQHCKTSYRTYHFQWACGRGSERPRALGRGERWS